MVRHDIEDNFSDILIMAWNLESGADELIGEEPCDLFSLSDSYADNFSFNNGDSSTILKSLLQRSPELISLRNEVKGACFEAVRSSSKSLTPDTKFNMRKISSKQIYPSNYTSGIESHSTSSSYENDALNCTLDNVSSLQDLKRLMLSFEGCALKATATNLVFSDGCPQASVMVIGEAPGADEDRIGKAFVGRSGQLLDKMLNSIGLNRENNVYISNIIPWRPPGNRTPSTAEVTVCLPFIKKHIELINPDILLLLGKSSSSALLNTTDSISRLRGKVFDYEIKPNKFIPALTTFHPAFLLREPLQKRFAWQDMLKLKKLLNEKQANNNDL